jgi:hypothetical protein
MYRKPQLFSQLKKAQSCFTSLFTKWYSIKAYTNWYLVRSGCVTASSLQVLLLKFRSSKYITRLNKCTATWCTSAAYIHAMQINIALANE